MIPARPPRRVPADPAPRPTTAATAPSTLPERPWTFKLGLVLFIAVTAAVSSFVHYELDNDPPNSEAWFQEFFNLAFVALPSALAVALLRQRSPGSLLRLVLAFEGTIVALLLLTVSNDDVNPFRALAAYFFGDDPFGSDPTRALLFAIPLLIAPLAGQRLAAATRLVIAASLGFVVFIALALGDPIAYAVELNFLYYLPIWSVLLVTGTGRHDWTRAQAFGITLAFTILWRPIFANLRTLHTVFTATGVTAPKPLFEWYQDAFFKFHYDVFLLFAALLLAMNVRPATPWNEAFHGVVRRFNLGVKRAIHVDLLLGVCVLLLTFGATLLFNWIAQQLPTKDVGADFSQVFTRITPDLVILLALAAGLGEELVFRGVLLATFHRGLRTAFPTRPETTFFLAALGQALLFGLVHAGYQNPLYLIAPFGFGLTLAYAVRYFGFLSAVYVHVAYDFIAFSYNAIPTHPWWGTVLGFFLIFNLVAGLLTPLYLLTLRLLFPRRDATHQP